jgi:NADH-quinone oxidoreductase subunit C
VTPSDGPPDTAAPVAEDDTAPVAEDDTAPVAEDATDAPATPEPNPVHEEMAAALQAAGLGGETVVRSESVFDDFVVRVVPDAWRRAGEIARDALDCDYLSFIAGIDWAPAPKEGGDDASGDTSQPAQPTEMTFGATGSAGRFQVFAHVQSTRRHWGLTLKTDLDEASPSIESWVPLYPGADWHERECWEMYGFVFEGHPSLRHLYLPSGFEGHPLRKDFPLLARVVKPWPGLVDVEAMPGESGSERPEGSADESSAEGSEPVVTDA